MLKEHNLPFSEAKAEKVCSKHKINNSKIYL